MRVTHLILYVAYIYNNNKYGGYIFTLQLVNLYFLFGGAVR